MRTIIEGKGPGIRKNLNCPYFRARDSKLDMRYMKKLYLEKVQQSKSGDDLVKELLLILSFNSTAGGINDVSPFRSAFQRTV